MSLITKKPSRSARESKSANRSKQNYFLISDLPNTEWLFVQLERELNCRIRYVPMEKSMLQKGDINKAKFPYTVVASLRDFAEKATSVSGLDAGFAVNGFTGQVPAASFLQLQTRHILFTDFRKETEVYESECLPISKSRSGNIGIGAGKNPLMLKSSELLWNFSGLIRKLKRKMEAQCPDCNTRGWAPALKSKRFLLGDRFVGGEELWLCRTCNYSELTQPAPSGTHSAMG